MDLNNLNYIVIGAGFFGAVIAERIASKLRERVLVVDRKSHIGGNSWSIADPATGIECHCYGSHIFHTSDPQVWNYINSFTEFNSYRHRVLTNYRGRIYQMPVNLATICDFYGRTMTPFEAAMLLSDEAKSSGIIDAKNLEEKAIYQIGRPLYDAFIRDYTLKQWKTDPKQLPADIITRLPVRYSYKSDYFDDPWQGIPLNGYHHLFERILDHPDVEVMLGLDFFEIREQIPPECTVIYTGPIDRFFGYKYGRLGWRTLDFEKEVCNVRDYQGTAVMNYADDTVPFTRVHEFRHFHDERPYPEDRTVISREYSRTCNLNDEPYYPVNAIQDREILALYRADADMATNVIFGGRLGSYRYLDMDKSIASALEIFNTRIRKES
ncbi:UDP-galactopyranose mutase [Geobacter sp. OR-1]|uniref:UDP-galactopyranose mutase n=1 Tax=Geobacter sp. OR-1 TaxID=1266765 RepID=UPI000542B0CF|nr:UDP-galactopyranose mutase [Geobacter sp. OR-1]GAM08924.1 UDP-galactopyranose mutase [Geobacter sp. OR-1]